MSVFLELFKRRVDVALSNMVSGHGEEGLVVGLDDLSGLCNFNDSMILCQ